MVHPQRPLELAPTDLEPWGDTSGSPLPDFTGGIPGFLNARDLPALPIPRLHLLLEAPSDRARYEATEALVQRIVVDSAARWEAGEMEPWELENEALMEAMQALHEGESGPSESHQAAKKNKRKRKGKGASGLTISEQMLADSYEAWSTGYHLQGALQGTLTATLLEGETPEWVERFHAAHTPEQLYQLGAFALFDPNPPTQPDRFVVACNAEMVRRWFEAGRPLSLIPYGSQERYAAFVPQLVYLGPAESGTGQYLAGNDLPFVATDHAAALRYARRWFNGAPHTPRGETDPFVLGQYRLETAAQQERAGLVVPNLWADFLGLVLEQDGVLTYPWQGRPMEVAWRRGAHDYWFVQGGEWAYPLKTTARSAASVAVLAKTARFGREGEPLGWDQVMRLTGLLGWEDIEVKEEGGPASTRIRARFAATETKPSVLIVPKGESVWGLGVQGANGMQPVADLIWTSGEEGSPPRIAMRGVGSQKQAESIYPPALALADALLWAAWRALR